LRILITNSIEDQKGNKHCVRSVLNIISATA